MSIEQVFVWLKSLNMPLKGMWCGPLDKKQPNSLGVYNSKRETPRIKALGGASETHKKAITLLIHGTKSLRETETLAKQVYDYLSEQDRPNIGGFDVNYIELPYDEPIYVSTDDSGIQEYVIDFNIYF